jgi:hypothetical protein
MTPKTESSAFVSFSDDTSLPYASCKVAMQGQVLAGHSLAWFHDLDKRVPVRAGREIKSSDIVEPFFALPAHERARLFLTLKTVRIHITDPRPYYGRTLGLERLLPPGTTLIQFLKRLHHEEHVAKAQVKFREFIAGNMLADAPSEHLKRLYRALEYTHGVRIKGFHVAEKRPSAPADLTPFKCGTSNMVNQVPPFLSQSASVFHHAVDALMGNPTLGLLHGGFTTNQALRAAHAFDRGKDGILPWIEQRRAEVMAFTNPYGLFPLVPAPLKEFDSKDAPLIRAADFAVAIAREIWSRNRSLVQVAASFEYVTYNGRRISENDAAMHQDRLEAHTRN